ncbi:hypothetical protein [Rhizobium sp. P28RR-XV]|uniref:hypothetical protein n=1 Tax=Rhizobium sp. P28RR-XV TaxID=2726737 RepID=UPI0014569D9E|nr:hypothetical protein [Rhizobium sp. P28RR-XV]NLR86256.1 hypothetical protein [Rhizobium sp. P28RR-XV]
MSVENHRPQWWSDIISTAIRLPQNRYRKSRMLPPGTYARQWQWHNPRKRGMKAFLVKVRRVFGDKAPVPPAVPGEDPLQAYIYACLAAPFFCYVPPAIYGLTVADEKRGAPAAPHQTGAM